MHKAVREATGRSDRTPALLMLADDLTGALDSGVQLAKAGLDTLVWPQAEDFMAEAAPAARVLVVNTASRHLPPGQARTQVARLAARGRQLGAELVYKKTDSALRGNVGAELAGVLDAFPGQRLWFAPALPAAGRITVGGVHMVEGVPVAESAFGRDPFTPVAHSEVPALLAHTGYGGSAVLMAPGETPPAEAGVSQVLTFNAESDADLAAVAATVRAEEAQLLAGCAGFAACLPALLAQGGALPKPVERQALPMAVAHGTQLVVLAGSLSPITARQVAYAAKAGFHTADIESAVRFAPPQDPGAVARYAQGQLAQAAGRAMVLYPATAHTPAGMATEQARRAVALNLGRLAAALRAAAPTALLMVVGGDTLAGAISALQVRTLRPLAEPDPGTVVALGQPGEMLLAAKSGGLGGPEAFVVFKNWLATPKG